MTAGAQGPAKRKRTKGGRYSHEITKDEIELYYHLPCEEASRQLGIGLTILKRICRRLGIEKWPYRQLKRAGKLGEVGAGSAGTAGAPSNLGGAAKVPAGSPKPAAARKRASPKAKPSRRDSNEHSTSPDGEEEGDDEEEDFPSGDAGSSGGSGSEGSWQAGHHGVPTPADGRNLQPASCLPAAGMLRQSSETLGPRVRVPQPAAACKQRGAPAVEVHRQQGRVSIDLGVMARAGGAFSGAYAFASPQLSGSVGGAASAGAAASRGMQPPQSGGALKRRSRDEEFDPLLCLMDNTSDAAQISPFTAAAQVPPEGAWTPGSDGGGPWPGVQDPGADQLAQGLSRLAMRTLSLKRQCSRGGEALDPLEAALLMERLEAQAQMVNVARSCSLPLTAKLGSPPMSRGARQGWLPPHARAGMQAERGGWTAAEHLRQQGGLESIVEPGEEGFLPLGDANLSNLRFGGSPHPKHALSSSDLISEGCLLPEATTAAPLDPLHHGGSSGVLLECGPNGARNGAAEAAMHARHTSGGSALPQAGASTCDTALPLQHGHAADLYGLAAGVTAVGPSSAEVAHDALYPELPSPFSIGSGPEQDREVDDLLVDFLSPAPFKVAEARMAELVVAFSPKASPHFAGMDDPALAGLALTPRAPGFAAADPARAGDAGVAALQPGDCAMPAAAAAAIPHAGRCSSGLAQGSPVAAPTGGSSSAPSHGTPTSSGSRATPQQGALDMPPAARLAQNPSAHKQAFSGQLMQMQGEHAQQAQQAEAAAWGGTPAAGNVLFAGAQELEQAVEQHQAMAQQYLHLRSEVQAMLSQRGSSQHLGALAGDQERLQQLLRLKQLKQHLAAAQARQLALLQQHDMQQQARSAAAAVVAVAQPVATSHQPNEQSLNPFTVQPSLLSDISSAFSGGLAPPLGPPPPLPGACGARPGPPLAQGQGNGMLSVAAMLQQWRGEAERAAAAPRWEPLLTAALPVPAPVLQAQVQPRLAQRTASAPLPWELGWAATA